MSSIPQAPLTQPTLQSDSSASQAKLNEQANQVTNLCIQALQEQQKIIAQHSPAGIPK